MYAERCSSKIFRSESRRYSLKTLQEVVNRYCDQAWHMLVHFGTNPFGGFLEEFYTLRLPKGSHGPNDHFNSRRISSILINSHPILIQFSSNSHPILALPSLKRRLISRFSRRLEVIFGLSPEMCAGRCHMRLRLAKAGRWMERLGDRDGQMDQLGVRPEIKMAPMDENGFILVNQINLYIYILILIYIYDYICIYRRLYLIYI